MTSNIDKLKLIAPLLAGRELYLYFSDDTGTTSAVGMFHSLEIDDVYPDSEPTVYIRATKVVHKREEGFPVYDAVLVSQHEEDYDEFVFPVDDLLSIKLVQSNEYGREDLITVEFTRKAGVLRDYVLFFTYGWLKR